MNLHSVITEGTDKGGKESRELLEMCFTCYDILFFQIQIQLYLATEGPLQLKVVLPWGRGYNKKHKYLKLIYK